MKIGTDPEAGLVDLTSPPTATTVAQLTDLPLPSPIIHRVRPTELTVYTITATLVDVYRQHDGDVHLAVNDGSGHFMITEVPDPACVPTTSPFYAGISRARSQLAAWSGSTPATVQITGVGFFDAPTGQSDQAPNQIELHPILDLNFHPGASPGSITGRVTRADGGPVSGASVNDGSDPVAHTGSNGSYTIPNVALGAYTVSASASGFVSESLLATVSSGTNSTANFVLAHAGGYALDGYGGVHPFSVGGGPALPVPTATPSWPGWDIARGVALLPDDSGAGYVLDGWGGLHAFGNAPPASDGPYWPGWSIARGVALLPDGTGGYVLDGWGGLHRFGGAPPVTGAPYWAGWDIARGVALLPDGTGGYVLDGWGGLHPFSVNGHPAPPAAIGGPYWYGWDIARGVALLPDGSGGYVLDGWGGLHRFGTSTGFAPGASGGPYWPGWDIARGVAL